MEDEPTAPLEESVADVPVSVVPCHCQACVATSAREFVPDERGLVITRPAALTAGGQRSFEALRGPR